MLSVKGTFRDGVALPTEAVEGVEGAQVIITFLDAVGESPGPGQPGLIHDSADLAEARDLERIVMGIRATRSIDDGVSVEDRAIRQRQNLLRAIEELSALPSIVQEEGLSNRDHDRIIYGSMP